MNVLVNLSNEKDKQLEKYRPKAKAGVAPEWTSVIEGFWSESMYHSGYYDYSLCQSKEGYWLLNQCSRNSCLDGVTKEDVEECSLNDDQLQGIWPSSPEFAPKRAFRPDLSHLACPLPSASRPKGQAGIYIKSSWTKPCTEVKGIKILEGELPTWLQKAEISHVAGVSVAPSLIRQFHATHSK
ncbi:MAG: hypothetical protein ACK52A_14640 [Planctomycetota bacterium]